jgi:protocatechuate 3,4-dioxygenase beta subunit
LRLSYASSFVFLIALSLQAALPAGAQNDKNRKQQSELRTVRGSVVDMDDNPVPSSIIYLKNLKTQGVATHIADDTGKYHFSGLDPNVDYEIHAEHDDLISPTRTISSFDTNRDMVLTLRLKHKKDAH